MPLLLLCLLPLCCCCSKAPAPVFIPPSEKAPIFQENPTKNPVLPVRHHEDKIIDEEIQRELYTVQRTLVQSVQIPAEEYKALYGTKIAPT